MATGPSHAHSHFGDLSSRTSSRLFLSLGITLAFVAVEALAGLWANSLALLSDAGHNLTDAVALGLSWYAVQLSARPAHAGKTFGYHRAGILVALFNSTTLAVIALGIFYEAYHRFLSPPPVQAGVLIAVGTVAFLVNAGTAWLVREGSEHDLNLRSAFLHLMGDVFSTIGAVLAGVIIAFTDMNWLDPLASLLIGMLILWNAWVILRDVLDILLEATPRDVDMDGVIADLLNVSGVRGVHDLHVWSITQSMRALSAHILTDNISISGGAAIQRAIQERIGRRYGIAHVTLQLECTGCEPDRLYCDLNGMNHACEEGDGGVEKPPGAGPGCA
ncbi:MAG: cation transporter [Deltaproteobacteria bacterium HGW-Deltaproteobacteria-19]|jgi:cobalt-zinc-cadmium efflux system protein|nr:MAG: cation transporter [Deltaproteobacteria bacterium HGW-Deltaproteobacteria-19]